MNFQEPEDPSKRGNEDPWSSFIPPINSIRVAANCLRVLRSSSSSFLSASSSFLTEGSMEGSISGGGASTSSGPFSASQTIFLSSSIWSLVLTLLARCMDSKSTLLVSPFFFALATATRSSCIVSLTSRSFSACVVTISVSSLIFASYSALSSAKELASASVLYFFSDKLFASSSFSCAFTTSLRLVRVCIVGSIEPVSSS
mmetsp:Transcript_32189/g.70239  ORF Transcript_32189/g.70239 Transcript_32189/m.70239 type:complete len:201 (+) Transcript_32189:182-784(+)